MIATVKCTKCGEVGDVELNDVKVVMCDCGQYFKLWPSDNGKEYIMAEAKLVKTDEA